MGVTVAPAGSPRSLHGAKRILMFTVFNMQRDKRNAALV